MWKNRLKVNDSLDAVIVLGYHGAILYPVFFAENMLVVNACIKMKEKNTHGVLYCLVVAMQDLPMSPFHILQPNVEEKIFTNFKFFTMFVRVPHF